MPRPLLENPEIYRDQADIKPLVAASIALAAILLLAPMIF